MNRATSLNSGQVARPNWTGPRRSWKPDNNPASPMHGPRNATARAIARVIYLWHVAGCRQILRGAA